MATPFDNLSQFSTESTPPAKKRKVSKPLPLPLPADNSKKIAKQTEDKEKSKLIFQIKQYQANELLGPAMKGAVELSGLSKLSVEQLKERLQHIDMALANHSNSNVVNAMARSTLVGLESLVTHRLAYNITGTTAKLWADKHFMFLLERAKYKHGLNWAPDIDPALELAIVIYTTAVACHAENATRDIAPKTDLSKKIPKTAAD